MSSQPRDLQATLVRLGTYSCTRFETQQLSNNLMFLFIHLIRYATPRTPFGSVWVAKLPPLDNGKKRRIMYISLATWRCPDAFQEFDDESRDALRLSLITMTLSPHPEEGEMRPVISCLTSGVGETQPYLLESFNGPT